MQPDHLTPNSRFFDKICPDIGKNPSKERAELLRRFSPAQGSSLDALRLSSALVQRIQSGTWLRRVSARMRLEERLRWYGERLSWSLEERELSSSSFSNDASFFPFPPPVPLRSRTPPISVFKRRMKAYRDPSVVVGYLLDP